MADGSLRTHRPSGQSYPLRARGIKQDCLGSHPLLVGSFHWGNHTTLSMRGGLPDMVLTVLGSPLIAYPSVTAHTPHSGALIPISRMAKTKICVHFLSLLEQITANWVLKTTNLFSHSSRGQKPHIRVSAGFVEESIPCLCQLLPALLVFWIRGL